MKFFQKEISLTPQKRGFHLITSEILDKISTEIQSIKIGQLTLKFYISAFIKYLNKILLYVHICCLDIMEASMVKWDMRNII